MKKQSPDKTMNKAECTAVLITSLNIDNDFISQAILAVFIDVCEVKPPDITPNVFGVRIGLWAIRDENLDIFITVKDAILALSAVQFAFLNLGVSGLSALTLALVKLFQNARRHGAKLTPDQAVVLAALKTIDSPIEFYDLLHNMRPETGIFAWDEHSLRHTLKSLKELPTLNGNVALVDEYSEDKWGLKGV